MAGAIVTPDPAPGAILPAGEARRRFGLYLALKLAGLAALAGGVVLCRPVPTAAGVILLLLGGGILFVRPRHLGLTTRPGA